MRDNGPNLHSSHCSFQTMKRGCGIKWIQWQELYPLTQLHSHGASILRESLLSNKNCSKNKQLGTHIEDLERVSNLHTMDILSRAASISVQNDSCYVAAQFNQSLQSTLGLGKNMQRDSQRIRKKLLTHFNAK